MDLLILGHSSIAQRRVVPAVRSLDAFGRIDVATRKASGGAHLDWEHGAVYGDYRQALARSDARLVYVSLVNSEHQRWAEAAIAAGRHVVVDKPAFLGLREAERALDMAERAGVCVAEATVWGYHPQIDTVRQIFADAGCAPVRITATFSFPPLDLGNFRYQRALGGGALWDVGPYAVSTARVFAGDEPTAAACHVLARGGTDVDTAFALSASFGDGRSLVGTFGFGTVYRNRVELLGETAGVEVDRIFTTPPDVSNEIRVTTLSGSSTVAGPAGDAFAAFFQRVHAGIVARDWRDLTRDLCADARFLQRLRDAAGVD